MTDTHVNPEMNPSPEKKLDPKTVRMNKIMFFTIIALPILVVLLSTLMFKTGIGVPTETTNNGVLVRPAQQIEALKAVAPKNLWILCDGPRPDKGGELSKVNAVRRQLENHQQEIA